MTASGRSAPVGEGRYSTHSESCWPSLACRKAVLRQDRRQIEQGNPFVYEQSELLTPREAIDAIGATARVSKERSLTRSSFTEQRGFSPTAWSYLPVLLALPRWGTCSGRERRTCARASRASTPPVEYGSLPRLSCHFQLADEDLECVSFLGHVVVAVIVAARYCELQIVGGSSHGPGSLGRCVREIYD
jgi:hypothetical protein